MARHVIVFDLHFASSLFCFTFSLAFCLLESRGGYARLVPEFIDVLSHPSDVEFEEHRVFCIESLVLNMVEL